MKTELYLKYRPSKFKYVIGQDEAVNILQKKWKSDSLPHVILFSGPAGTGKTTLGRIVATCLECSDIDFEEKNSADYRGIDSVREIRNTMSQAPMNGPVKVILFDEIHKCTNDAQNAMLKMLEDTPKHVYFILCTTEPEKLLPTIRQRCLKIDLKPIKIQDLDKIIENVRAKEKIKITEEVHEKIVEYAGGSAREALQLLDKVYQLETEEEQLDAIEKASLQAQAISLARLLINTKTKWPEVGKLLKELRQEDSERIRYLVLSYATSILLKKANERAMRMLEEFSDNFYDSKFAGVVGACYNIINGE